MIWDSLVRALSDGGITNVTEGLCQVTTLTESFSTRYKYKNFSKIHGTEK